MKNTFLSQRFYREAVLALLLGCSLLPAQASPIQADDMEVDTALLAPQAQHTVMPLAHEAPEQAQVHQRYTAEEIAQATAFPFENVLKKRDFSLFNTTEQAFSKGFKAAKILADVAFDQDFCRLLVKALRLQKSLPTLHSIRAINKLALLTSFAWLSF